jgi:hypothetical protein
MHISNKRLKPDKTKLLTKNTDTMKRCKKELFVEQYFGLIPEATDEKTIIVTDFGQVVNLLAMFIDSDELLSACKSARAIFQSQGINSSHSIVGEIYKKIEDAIADFS